MLVTIMPFVLIIGVTVFAGGLAWLDWRASKHDREVDARSAQPARH